MSRLPAWASSTGGMGGNNSPSTLLHRFTKDRLRVEIHTDRDSLGLAAAIAVAGTMRASIESQDRVGLILASAPSQYEFLAALSSQPRLRWRRVAAFQMDEFIDLPKDSPRSLGSYLRKHLFDAVRPGLVNYMRGYSPDLSAEITRYTSLFCACPPDITCAGIGENGHLAFNEPRVADFETSALVAIAELTDESRRQQANDGLFDDPREVPLRALTLTVPALLSASMIVCMAPGESKAEAVRAMLTGPVTTDCPASILRSHPNATLYLDAASARVILGPPSALRADKERAHNGEPIL